MRSHHTRRLRAAVVGIAGSALLASTAVVAAVAETAPTASKDLSPRPVWSAAVAQDVSPTLSALAKRDRTLSPSTARLAQERGAPNAGGAAPRAAGTDAAVQSQLGAAQIAGPTVNFEGLSNQDNFDVFGFRVNPPDPVGDIGPNHYVEMVNLVFGVYSRTGELLLGPVDTGALWADFPVEDCTDPSGDPIVLYDQLVDRWILSQFTTRGLSDPSRAFYNCVAVSTTGDPTGTYFRYAFETENFQYFPDYPKYGVWTDSYVITTREFGPTIEYGIGIYALEKNKMVNGEPARAVSFFLDGYAPGMLPLIGDGLLPADIDGNEKPKTDAAIPLVGTQDDDYGYGATFDALNVWDLRVKWRAIPAASLTLPVQLPVAAFDSAFPCGPTSRDCLPQPGIHNPNQFLDVLSYRQRPTWRLAYRSFRGHESLVTTQSVEAAPRVAGMRWYEIRRGANGYALHQQGTFAPSDGVHRWMGSIAQDRLGNLALGYSVVNGSTVFPGIRYTGRTAGDPPGQMTLGEGTVINGTGVQTTANSRWGDYTSMNVDPVDDCTFWYVNEYYSAAGQAASAVGWQTRVASFRLPGC